MNVFVSLFPKIVLVLALAALFCVCAVGVVVGLRHLGCLDRFRWLFHRFRHPTSWLGWICTVPLVCVLIVAGSEKNGGGDGTNAPPLTMSAPMMVGGTGSGSPEISSEDIARGYRAGDAARQTIVPMPSGTVTNEPLRRRGGFDWAFRVEPEGWRFPYRDGFLEGVTVVARGEVRPDVGSLFFPVPITNGVSLLPEARWGLLPHTEPRSHGEGSLFRHAVTTNGSLVLDWHNALVGRDVNCPTNLQMELYRDGSFAWRTDDAAQFYLPVFPFDWDGDGLENSVDPDPITANSVDAHGTNAEWYNTVCPNVFTTTQTTQTTQTTLPPGISFRTNANARAYYFVDVVSERGPAPIYFNPDRDTRLGSPVVVALAGETNRVPLLIGVKYAVTSTVPISVSVPDAMYAVVTSNSEYSATVRWPLEFAFTESIGTSNRTYTVSVEPYDPGGEFVWDGTQQGGGALLMSVSPNPSCACHSAFGNAVTYSCSSTCGCGGTCLATGLYLFESTLFAVTGGVCRCGFEDPPPSEEPHYDPSAGPGFSIDFSKSAVIFEDAYEDAPGVTKPKRSTRVRLTVAAYGGPNGGTFLLAHQNLDKLAAVADGPIQLPSTRTLAPGEDFYTTCVYEAEEASGGEEDIYIWGYFIENETSERYDSHANLTSIKILLCSVDSILDLAHRHQWGLGERIYCECLPTGVGLQIMPQNGCVKEHSYPSREDFSCPMIPANGILYMSYANVCYRPNTRVVEPTHVEARMGEELLFTIPVGVPGGVGVGMDLHVMPDTVSFRALEFVEEPCEDSVIEGYFTNSIFRALWYHTTERGAGVWHGIQNENFWFHDEAMMGDQLPLPAYAGHIIWNIPIEWRPRDEDGALPQRLAVIPQSFIMSSDGTLRVSKYNYWTERSLSGERHKSEGVR